RNAGVLARQMISQGLMEPLPVPSVPELDRDLWNRVAGLDLEPVTAQLIDYQGWTAVRAAAAEQRYRRFFYLKATLPNGASPTVEIDQFWHQHILNTERYGPDCWHVAGRFLNHTFLSPADEAQAKQLQSVWLTTWVCYETRFEAPYEETIGAALLQRWPKV